MKNYQQKAELEVPSYGGTNTALQFSLIPKEQSPRSRNTYMDTDGDISKRPGTIPVTISPLAASTDYITTYKLTPNVAAGDDIYVTSGTTLYKWDGVSALIAQTMTAALASSSIHSVGFTNASLVSRLLIADTAALKQSDGTTVTLVTPAADDPSPAPANGLSAINIKGIKFIWEYSGHVFISPGTTELFYMKRFQFDYAPVTYYFQLVRDNDFINGDGVAFDAVCLVPMRRGWAIITGTTFSNFDASNFLNTTRGVIAPRSIAKITYPDGTQSIAYLSDNEAHEVYTSLIDGGGRQYATRSLMQGKINFSGLGLTDAEKAAAVGVFHPEKFIYLLSFQKAGVDYTYCYDTRNKEWYTDWLTFNAKGYASLNGTLYFVGAKKHLKKFDTALYSDWNESTKTTGTYVYYKRYTPALSLEFSGFPSMWDAYVIESKLNLVPSTLDITFVFSNITDVFLNAVRNEVFVEDVSQWDVAAYANTDFTDLIAEQGELLFDFSRVSRYVQVLVENNRDQPVKIFKEKLKGRISGR